MFHPSMSNATLHHSKPMPKWLWYIISKSLGIKTHPNDKPILATLLYIFTLVCTLTYLITCSWYVVYDIESKTTKFDVLNGSVTVIMAAGFCSITVYANLLAFKLFTNVVFRQSLRLHSKTILKVNVSLLLVVLGLLFIGIYAHQCYKTDFGPGSCETIKLNPIICLIRFSSQTVLSVISLLWNLMVAVVCLSVCRTHTISIRHYLQELDNDAIVYETQHRHPRLPTVDGRSIPVDTPDMGSEPGSDFQDEIDFHKIEAAWDRSEFQRRRHRVSSICPPAFGNEELTVDQELPDTAGDVHDNRRVHIDSISSAVIITQTQTLLTKSEILEQYWRIQCRLNTTSTILQRWLTSWIILILIWSVYFLMYWIDHNAHILDMVLFFIPLALLPLLCSGPIELNGEGERVSKMICPTEERMEVILFIRQAPLSFAIYGFVLNYSTIITAILAIAVAFGTKVILGNIDSSSVPDATPSPPL